MKLPSTGTYLLAIAGQNAANASVSYSFEVFDNVNPTSTLTLGTGVSGTIANPGDSHSYTFTGSAGQRLYYDGLASANYYLFVNLTDPYGNTLINQTSSSSDQGPLTLSYSGTYTLTVYSYSNQRATGAYAFTLDDASAAKSIALTPGSGTTESGTLATGLTTDLYKFSGTAGQSVFFQGQLDSPASGAIAYLYGPTNGFVTYFYLDSGYSGTSDVVFHRDVSPGGGRAERQQQLSELSFRGLRQRQHHLDVNPGGRCHGDADQPRRRGQLHLHRQPWPEPVL